MVYVKRDEAGRITAVSAELQSGFSEQIEETNSELCAFLGSLHGRELAQSDLDLIRVLEDLVYLLIEKNLIRFTDLPDAAQSKLMAREALREQLQRKLDLLDGEDEAPLV